MKNILVVEDEKEIVDLIEFYLNNEGFKVTKCYDGNSAISMISKYKYDLAILDVMLPDINGFDVCKKIRENHYYPIIMLTARNEDMDKIMGLTIGADDYMTKPFNPLELIARIKTQLRRYNSYNQVNANCNSEEELDIRGLVINRSKYKCSLYGSSVELTPIEFSILWYLCVNQGKVISTEELFENVWEDKYLDNNNTVMAHIARLREKLNETSRKPKFIKTIWGVGYTVE
ncbi:MAG: VanR-ABDEGLN family response regulator transcription factor [Paraclostridium sp.]